MSQTTKIEWTDRVWNPVTGCHKVSPGCKYCYAEVIAQRFWATQYPPNTDGTPRKFTDVRLHSDRLNDPTKWRKPAMVFVNSMSDLFHEKVPFEFIDEVFFTMAWARQHTFQVLTKRPKRMLEYLEYQRENKDVWPLWPIGERDDEHAPFPLPNVWLGVSVENDKTADERIPWLLRTPAAVKFLSCEPLLGPLNIRVYLREYTYNHRYDDYDIGRKTIDWVIAGGESGHNARPMHPNWVRELRDDCVSAKVPFFFKQWGTWLVSSHMNPRIHRDPGIYSWPWKSEGDTTMMMKMGKKAAGRVLDGLEWNEFPEVKS